MIELERQPPPPERAPVSLLVIDGNRRADGAFHYSTYQGRLKTFHFAFDAPVTDLSDIENMREHPAAFLESYDKKSDTT